jgi:hypothetical protein
MNKNGKKFTAEKKFNIFLSTIAMYLSLGLLIPQKSTFSTSKHEIEISSLFCGSFFPSWIRIYWPD